MGAEVKRRTFLTALAGTGGFAVAGSTTISTAENHCTPGHDDDDSACRQVYDDRKVLTPFEAEDSGLPVGISYPCGWTTGVNESDHRIQLNTRRSGIGEDDAYVDIQVRGYYEPVQETIIEDIKADGDYVEVEYEFAGETRTGLVSSRESAQYGTLGHAAIPMGESYVHIELISTMKGTECTLDPRPDWWAVRDMLRTLTTNRESTFIEDSGYLPEYATARIDPNGISYDETNERVEVPAKSDVLIPGLTNLATVSNLTVQVASKAGEDTAFYNLQEGVPVEGAPNRDWQVWDVTVSDEFVNAEGTEFEIKIRVDGYSGEITPGGLPIEGIVVEWVGVRVFEFTDQTSQGDTVVVDKVEMTNGGTIALEDTAGTPLGRSVRLTGGELHENVSISLDESLAEGTHELTAKLLQPSGDPYPEDNTRTATVTVDEAAPALFQITDLTPETTQIDAPGEAFTVTATIENTGSQEGATEIVLELHGSVQKQKTVTVAGGESTTVSFDVDTSGLEPGSKASFTVSTDDGSASGSVDVGVPETSEVGTPSEDADTTSTPENGDGGVSAEDGPGFGVGGAVAAVLAAMGLASRYADSE